LNRAWFRILALLLALTMVAAACGGDDDDGGDEGDGDASAPTVPETPDEAGCDETVPGSQINYGVFAPTASLDPPFVSGALVGGTELAAVYDMLIHFDYETSEYSPKLAESLEPNDDFTQWTLKLRDGITYSDGTQLTAQLVSDNLDRFRQEGVRNTAGGFLGAITDRQVVDDLTLEMTLEYAWPEFPFVFADEPGMIVNTNAIGDDPESFGAQPPEEAGLGPYTVVRNTPGEELVLQARDDYWDGPVCVETLRFVFVPGAQATYESFQSGQLDVGFLRDAVVIANAKDNDEENFFVPQDAGAAIIFNHAEGRPAADPKVREAMALAIDENTINDRAYSGQLSVSKSLIQPGSRFHSDAVESMETDADRARAALEEAKAGGFDGTIELVCADAPPAPETALTVEGMLEAVGFQVEVRTLPTAEQIGEIIQGNYDAACWGFNADAATGITTLVRNFSSESATNRMKYANPDMDAALEALTAAESGSDEQLEAAAEINNIVNRDFVTVNYGAPEEGIVWNPKIKGIVPQAATIFLFDKAYIDD
jgi:peptide/nickel transport system substrate-binding protein